MWYQYKAQLKYDVSKYKDGIIIIGNVELGQTVHRR